MSTPIVYTVASPNGSVAKSVTGYASTLNQLLLFNHDSGGGDPRTFLNVSGTAFTLASFTADPNAGSAGFRCSSGMSSGCDAAGNWYSDSGSGQRYVEKYDTATKLKLTSNTDFPTVPSSGTPSVNVQKNNSNVERVVAFEDNAGQIAVWDTNMVLQGYAFVRSPSGTVSPSSFTSCFDKNGLLWALTNTTLGNNNNSNLVSIDPAGGSNGITHNFNTVSWYTVSGATYGQGQAMWYVSSDHSLVIVTRTGFLIKWDIATQAIVAHVDYSAQIGPQDYGTAAGWAKTGTLLNNKIHFGGLLGILYVLDAVTLAIDTTYNFRTLLSNGTFGWPNLPLQYLPEQQLVVFNYTGNTWKIVQLSPKIRSRMVFINT
jgi:hypothetical protein